jgi:hypothetical protein
MSLEDRIEALMDAPEFQGRLAELVREEQGVFDRLAGTATDETKGAVSAPSNDSVDPVLVSLCVERAAARLALDDPSTSPWQTQGKDFKDRYRALASDVVESIVPLLLEAGAKAERERIKARIQGLSANRNPHWTPDQNRVFGIGIQNAVHVIDEPEDGHCSAALASITEEGKAGE